MVANYIFLLRCKTPIWISSNYV